MIDTTRDIIFDYGAIKNSEFLSPVKLKDLNQNTKCVNIKGENSIMKLENLYYKYETQKKWVLNDISMVVNEGDKIAVVGHIGSGKSTLLKILLRLLKPTKGHVYLFGKCINEFDSKTFYRNVGLMPQNCVLFNRPIIDNIKYDNEKVTDKMIYAAIHKFGVMSHFSNLKDGLKSLAGKNGMNLSGGQRQLVWFLKIYFKNPKIIIMDEPTASLDKETKDLFMNIMGTILKNKTIIMVTHDDYIMKFAQRVIRIKDGKVKEEDVSRNEENASSSQIVDMDTNMISF